MKTLKSSTYIHNGFSALLANTRRASGDSYHYWLLFLSVSFAPSKWKKSLKDISSAFAYVNLWTLLFFINSIVFVAHEGGTAVESFTGIFLLVQKGPKLFCFPLNNKVLDRFLIINSNFNYSLTHFRVLRIIIEYGFQGRLEVLRKLLDSNRKILKKYSTNDEQWTS